MTYSCVFWREFIDLIGFFGCYCLTPNTLYIIRSKGIREKQPAVRTLSTRRRFAARKPIESQMFLARGKLLSSLHRSKRLKAKYPHVCCWKRTFLRAMSKIPSFSRRCDTATGHGALAPRSNFPRPRVVQSTKKTRIWMIKTGRTSKMAISNHSAVLVHNTLDHEFSTTEIKITSTNNKILQFGYTPNFHDMDSVEYQQMILEEKGNGTYIL